MQRFEDTFGNIRLPHFLKWLVSRPAAHSWIVILLCADLAALGDAATGPAVWFGPVYLLVICLATWCRGWRGGLVTGFGCMAMTLLINGAALYPFAHGSWLPNLAARVGAMAAIIFVIAGSRAVYIREWWMARTDVLTGAFNRQALFELGEELAGYGCWRLLLYADLDGLKKINDLCGHAAGDRSIVSFATAVRQAIRRTDLFARVGGDEFVIFMAVRDRQSAEGVAVRLHLCMNRLHDEDGAGLRCSVGALIVAPGEMKMDNLVRAADALMYEAKLQGAGLQVRVADSNGHSAVTGRARKASRMPSLGQALTREPSIDRRGLAPAAPRPASAVHRSSVGALSRR